MFSTLTAFNKDLTSHPIPYSSTNTQRNHRKTIGSPLSTLSFTIHALAPSPTTNHPQKVRNIASIAHHNSIGAPHLPLGHRSTRSDLPLKIPLFSLLGPNKGDRKAAWRCSVPYIRLPLIRLPIAASRWLKTTLGRAGRSFPSCSRVLCRADTMMKPLSPLFIVRSAHSLSPAPEFK
jgi:hypothetical protein